MTELISSFVEAISGYLIGRFHTNARVAKQISLITLSLVTGILFFTAFGLYELSSPAPNPMGNVWLGLLFFSVCLSIIVYLILLIDILVKNRKKK